MQHLCEQNDSCRFIAVFGYSKHVEDGISKLIYYAVAGFEATVIVLLALVAIPSCFLAAVRKVFERCFATARIHSYEREKRLEISIILIIVSVLFSGLFAYVIEFCISNPLIYLCMAIAFAIGSVGGLTALYLHRLNNIRLDRIVSWQSRDFYTIGYKYQLLENLRAFKLLFAISVCGSIGIVIAVLALMAGMIAWKNRNVNIRVLFGALFEAVNALTVLIVIIVGQQSQWMLGDRILAGLRGRLPCYRR
ncbi:hypothetical protein PENTCL1PPCAC_19116, partial [Pristionchus entomophagus]